MYKCNDFKEALSYRRGSGRGHNDNRSDVMDGTEYKRLHSSVTKCKHFVYLAYCADAIAADKRISRSILPGIFRCV